MTAKEAKENKEVVIRNEKAIDYTSFYVDGFHMNMSMAGAFKLIGFADQVELPYEERYTNGAKVGNGNTQLNITRLEEFEIVLTPGMAIQLYTLLKQELTKYNIPLEMPTGNKDDKKLEVVNMSYDPNYR